MYATQSWLYPDMYLVSPFHISSVYSEHQHHNSFCLERDELVSVPHDYPVRCTNYYSVHSGVFIGDKATTKYLTRSKSWRLTELQPAHPTHSICNVGWSRSEKAWVGFKNPHPTASHKRIFKIGQPKYPDTYTSGLIESVEDSFASAVRYAIDINARPPSELPEREQPAPLYFIPPAPPTLREQPNAINEGNENERRQV